MYGLSGFVSNLFGRGKIGFPGQEHFFHDKGNYKFSSAVDGCVLEVPGAKVVERPTIITWDWTNSGHQKFWAYSAPEGDGFRLVPNLAPAIAWWLAANGKQQVLDQGLSDKALYLYSSHGGLNQQWHAELIPGGDGAVVVVNMKNEYCLKNVGRGKQVKCSPKAYEDKSIWWYLTSV